MMKILKVLFVENVFIKVLALILAIFTYLYIHLEDIDKKTIQNVSIQVGGLPRDWRVTRMSKEELDIIIVGPREKIEIRNKTNVIVYLDMSSIDLSEKEGGFGKSFEITENEVRGLDYDIQLEQHHLYLETVEVEVALYSVKKLNITPVIKGQPAPGFEERWRKSTPTVVDVTGPDNIIRYIDSIPTTPIDITGRTETIDVIVGMDTDFLEEEQGVDFECHSKVQVSIEIKPRPSEKTFTGIPIQVLKTQERVWHVKSEPSTIDVTITGDLEELEKINNAVIKAYIDVGELPPSPAEDVTIGVKFFFIGEWKSLRVKDKFSVKVATSLK